MLEKNNSKIGKFICTLGLRVRREVTFLKKKTEVNSQYSFEKKRLIYYLNACVDRLWRSDELMKNIYIYIIYIKYIFCCIVNKARG